MTGGAGVWGGAGMRGRSWYEGGAGVREEMVQGRSWCGEDLVCWRSRYEGGAGVREEMV